MIRDDKRVKNHNYKQTTWFIRCNVARADLDWVHISLYIEHNYLLAIFIKIMNVYDWVGEWVSDWVSEKWKKVQNIEWKKVTIKESPW